MHASGRRESKRGPGGTMDRFAKSRKLTDADGASSAAPEARSSANCSPNLSRGISGASTPSRRSGATCVDTSAFTGGASSASEAPVTRSAWKRHLHLLSRFSAVASSSFVFRAFVARLQTISKLPYDCACPVVAGRTCTTRLHDLHCHHASTSAGPLEQSLGSCFELIRRASIQPEDLREEHLLCSIWILGLFEHSRVEGRSLRSLVSASLEGIPAGVLTANDVAVPSGALDRLVDRVIRMQPGFLGAMSFRCWIPGPVADSIVSRIDGELKALQGWGTICAWNDLVCSITQMAALQLGLATGWPSYPFDSPPPAYPSASAASSAALGPMCAPLDPPALDLGVPANSQVFIAPWELSLLCDSEGLEGEDDEEVEEEEEGGGSDSNSEVEESRS